MHEKSERISKFTKLEGWYSNTSNFESAVPVNSANLVNMFNVLKLKYIDIDAKYALYKCVQLSEIDDEIDGTSFNSHSVGIQGAVASYDRKHKQIKLEIIDMDDNSTMTCTGNGKKFRGTSVKTGTDCLGGYVGGSKLKKLKVAPAGFETFDFDDVYTSQYDFVYNPQIDQLTAHKAKAIVITCMDFRLIDDAVKYFNSIGLKNNYDEFILAGASLGYNQTTYSAWSETLDKHIELAERLHDIEEVIVMDHMKCGAYKIFYDQETISRDDEIELHKTNFALFIQTINTKYPNLAVTTLLMDLDGSIISLPTT